MRDAADICDQKQDAYAAMSRGPEYQPPGLSYARNVGNYECGCAVWDCESEGGGYHRELCRTHAAAPKLLEALQNLLAWANIQDHHSLQAIQLRDNARIAIAEATP